MSIAVDNYEDVASKKSSTSGKAKEPKKPNRSPAYDLFARIHPDLEPALEAYLANVKPRSGKSAVVELALQEFLAKAGFWPLQKED